MSGDIPAKIRQRRAQMLVHSYQYYVRDSPIVSDDDWQRWADELTQLQKAYPHPIGFYDDVFADWDGTTGMHLPQDDWVYQMARRVELAHDKRTMTT